MTFTAILTLAVGLAMDATAVAAARGLAATRIRAGHVLTVAAFFGGFQALMPIIGWVIGSHLGPLERAWDHWIAFALLGAIGARMIREARGPVRTQEAPGDDPFGVRVMLLLAVATSIDALAAGVTLPILDAPPALTFVTIGVTTALMSALGLFAGRRFGALVGRRLDLVGGIVLIGLGVKILVEHLRA